MKGPSLCHDGEDGEDGEYLIPSLTDLRDSVSVVFVMLQNGGQVGGFHPPPSNLHVIQQLTMIKQSVLLRLSLLTASIVLISWHNAAAQTTFADLDRDGIPNISDPDVDNDGIRNGADRNIDGGIAQSGPLRGRYIGDNLPNNSPQELDMDADGLADNALNETDIDGDGLADNALNETDIDGDGLADNAPNETDIDGDGLADNALNETDIDGDGLADNALNETDIDGDGLAENALNETDIDGDGLADGAVQETDIDGDGLADNAPNETDIDGDGLPDNAAGEGDIDGDGLIDDEIGEVDTDGDGIANGLDGDLDGDELANGSDADMYGTGLINDLFAGAGADAAYAPDATVIATITYVSGEIRRILQIPSTDTGLRVRVNAIQTSDRVSGMWRYLSSDNMQVYAAWCYPANNPSDLKIFVQYQYIGPFPGSPADRIAANYGVSSESRAYALYPGGGLTFVSWVAPRPAGFYYTAYNQQATGFAPPFQPLVTALSTLPNFTSNQQTLTFTGNFSSSPGLPSLQPVINLQRTLMNVSRAWYGQLEAQQLR
jgi:hypothetical protein